MANAVLSNNRFRDLLSILVDISASDFSTVGKSSAGNVDNVERKRPAFTVNRCPTSISSISALSGSSRQISTNFRAGTVISPLSPSIKGTRPTISTSRSVPVRDNMLPSTCSNTFDNTGKVCRLSTTPATCCSGFNSASLLTRNFMEFPIVSAHITHRAYITGL